MESLQIFFLSIILSFVMFGLIARWYLMPWLKALPFEQALRPLLLFHGFRYLGLAFLVPGVVAPDLPSSFATPAGYGDLLAAALALLALLAFRLQSPVTIPLVWLFNIAGTLDFLYAFFQGIRSQINPGQLGATYFIPTVIVPAMLICHIIIFRLLLQSERRGTSS